MKSKKILMSTMSMDIGGAETHIVELSKELAARGHTVMVASNGGVYVKELESQGIRHFKVPLHRKSPWCILTAYRRLREIIELENPDIVHAHARIPGFICGLIRRKVKFNFVTTAHWVFNAKGLWGRLTNWGQKTVAVSEDIRAYLLKNYEIDEKDIFVTINGIDTERFSARAPGEKVRDEFDIPAEAPVISHVSRISRGRAVAASQLIEIAPELARRHDDLYLIIAGGGDLFAKLSRRAEEVNRVIGRRCILMIGPRTDIAEVIAAGDVFVGVSRAALEAMSVGKPAIVAGDEGYIGLFDENMLDIATATNFCCRGCPMSEEEKLKSDLESCLTLPENERSALGEYGRSVVMDCYSVRKMTDICVDAYRAVTEQSYNILISGYYGYGNAGDEAILNALQKNLLNMEIDSRVSVLSNSPAYTASQYDVTGVYRFSPREIFKSVRKCDLLVSGGGSLLQDRSSTRSLIYYLSIIRMAKLFKKQTMLYANGIGPISKRSNRRIARRILDRTDIITVREEGSLKELAAMGMDTSNVHVTADPVFLLEGDTRERSEELLSEMGFSGARPVAGISIRELNIQSSFPSEMAELGDYIYETLGRDILFIVMQSSHDLEPIRVTQGKMKNPSHIMESKYTSEEVMGITGCMDFVVTMRLHSMLFAAKKRVPAVGLLCDPKIKYFCEKLDMPLLNGVNDFDLEEAKNVVRELSENREMYAERLNHYVEQIEKDVHLNEVYLKEALKGCK